MLPYCLLKGGPNMKLPYARDVVGCLNVNTIMIEDINTPLPQGGSTFGGENRGLYSMPHDQGR